MDIGFEIISRETTRMARENEICVGGFQSCSVYIIYGSTKVSYGLLYNHLLCQIYVFLSVSAEWLEKQDIDDLLSKASSLEDPCLMKRLMLKKIRRDMGLDLDGAGEDTEELMAYIAENIHIVVDPETGECVPIIPPALAKMLRRNKKRRGGKHRGSGEQGKRGRGFDASEVLAKLRAEEEESGGSGGGGLLFRLRDGKSSQD